MGAEELAKLLHVSCEEVGPEQDPPKLVLPWHELPDWMKKTKIAVATRALKTIEVRKKWITEGYSNHLSSTS